MEVKTINGICEICGMETDVFELGVQDNESGNMKDICACKSCVIELHSGNEKVKDKFLSIAKEKLS